MNIRTVWYAKGRIISKICVLHAECSFPLLLTSYPDKATSDMGLKLSVALLCRWAGCLSGTAYSTRVRSLPCRYTCWKPWRGSGSAIAPPIIWCYVSAYIPVSYIGATSSTCILRPALEIYCVSSRTKYQPVVVRILLRIPKVPTSTFGPKFWLSWMRMSATSFFSSHLFTRRTLCNLRIWKC